MATIHVNDKDINTKNFYVATQISKLISSKYSQFEMNINENLLDSLTTLSSVMKYCSIMFYPVLGNNLAQTNFNILTVNVMKTFLKPTVKDEVFMKAFVSILNVNWNCSDSSEKYCIYLLNTDNFKDLISKIFCNTPYDNENGLIVQSSMSIINNIIRRQTLRNNFDSNLMKKLIEIYNSPITTKEFKIISCAMIFYLSSDKEVKQYFSLADEIMNDIITTLDATSHNNTLHADGFKLTELLEILTVFCKINDIKKYAEKSNTLFTTLLRVLSQDRYIENVIDFARHIYSVERFREFKSLFFKKYGNSNEKIIELLREP